MVEPGDEIVAATRGLAGWSINWYYFRGCAAAVPLFIILVAAGPPALGALIAVIVTVAVIQAIWFWTRKGITVVVTRQRQML